MMKSSQRGFTLLETLLALGVMTAIGLFLFSTLAGVLRWNGAAAQRENAEASLGGFIDRLEAEEDTAWAIFTPPQDVHGKNNSDGHELDFFLRDARNRAHFWAYCYDRATLTLQRFVYSAPGSGAIAGAAPIHGSWIFSRKRIP